ncbi:hypothetical protein NEOLEDRAFT_380729 [Neolentinus lepideus HHB14362 ss-1]|uniref:Uncharacterized protein n=1 Tax=Neolentinus lepideus HHB14362 ss-1 TaxID=1314782 RepID=A0A165SCI3_9AGAM|nr:hypothetical protein NEOLEDRAFT_380729 [Neolentinus lepideus HHB14362 ss-1]
MAEKKAKVAVYEKRKLQSIPAPIDSDSDPEFNAGAYVYEKPKKTRTKKNAKKDEECEEVDVLYPKNAGPSRIKLAPNSLAGLFGDLDLHSASESEDDEVPEDRSEDSSQEDRDGRKNEEPPIVLKSLSGIRSQEVKTASGDESVTESESGNEILIIPPKRKLDDTSTKSERPAKKLKSGDDGESSVTESESESEIQSFMSNIASTRHKLPSGGIKPSTADEDSVTESESDNPLDEPISVEIRPNFPRLPDQQRLGPFVLDAKAHVKIPASINTHLRDYQRDGVRFFWERYKAGHGGLLGDDMGLVKQFKLSHFCPPS